MNSSMSGLAKLLLELEKRSEVLEPLSADDKSKALEPKVESGDKPATTVETTGGSQAATGELKPTEAGEASDKKVTVQEAGNKPLAKAAAEADNVRSDLKPLEAKEPSEEKIVPEVSGNKPVKAETPGDQAKLETPAETKKEAKVLAADDKPVNTPVKITAEGSEAAKLKNDDSKIATQQASEAVGKAVSDFTMARSQEKGTDPSLIHTERGSGRAQDSKKIAAIIAKQVIKKASFNKAQFMVKLAKAISKKQQKYMGLVHAVQKGDMKAPSAAVAETAKEMKPKAVKDYAETKRKGLPEKKAASLRKKIAMVSPAVLAAAMKTPFFKVWLKNQLAAAPAQLTAVMSRIKGIPAAARRNPGTSALLAGMGANALGSGLAGNVDVAEPDAVGLAAKRMRLAQQAEPSLAGRLGQTAAGAFGGSSMLGAGLGLGALGLGGYGLYKATRKSKKDEPDGQ